MINVIIADDEAILRESIKFRLDSDASINVVGCAENGNEVYEICKNHNVDVVLMDIKMPKCDGIKATKRIKENFSSTKILILTTFTNDENFRRAISNGADGYVLKDVMPEDLINAIKNVHSNFKIIHDDVFKIISNVEYTSDNSLDVISKYNLNEKELLIIKYIVEGESTKEMSKKIFLSEGRIRNIIVEILNKLNLRDRVQLAVFAIKNKLVN